MKRPIVFLDIDGVLTHFGSQERLDPESIAHLNRLLDVTTAAMVLTSSWRDAYGVEETQRRLEQHGFRGRIEGVAPVLPAATRSDEIAAYLAAHDCPRFVIVDDVPVSSQLQRHLVLVDDFVGLTAADVDAAVKLLT